MQKAAKYVVVLLKFLTCRMWLILVSDMGENGHFERCGKWLMAFSEYIGKAGDIGKG